MIDCVSFAIQRPRACYISAFHFEPLDPSAPAAPSAPSAPSGGTPPL